MFPVKVVCSLFPSPSTPSPTPSVPTPSQPPGLPPCFSSSAATGCWKCGLVLPLLCLPHPASRSAPPAPLPLLPREKGCLGAPTLTQEKYQMFPFHQHQKFWVFFFLIFSGLCVKLRNQERSGEGGRGGRGWGIELSPEITSIKVKQEFKVGTDSISWASGGLVSCPGTGGAGPGRVVLAQALVTHSESHPNN